mmetsp:Transcript_113522/g.321204  ORF Transcript_113522/g.321204 Transcript_113522/m.321204 type:complete len:337 (-) Transcript_113522:132-1142(-)
MARLPALEGSDPDFPVPCFVAKHRCKGIVHVPLDDVAEDEFQWMEARRPLVFAQQGLALDYGSSEASCMQQAFVEAGTEHLLGVLNWPGVGTRWREFLEWCQEETNEGRELPATPGTALRAFGRALGRVTTYRALAIDGTALQRIIDADCIFPSGQLRVGTEELENIVRAKGIQTVCVARLFISHLHRLLRYDPSVSLHDDWQTTTLIASGYASHDVLDPSRSRRVHLFELSCPKIESVGWTLQEVALRGGDVLGGDMSDHRPWFSFPAPAVREGIWFDGRWQRTERYGLYGVPFLSRRLQQVFVFASNEEIGKAVAPFAKRQNELHEADMKASGA